MVGPVGAEEVSVNPAAILLAAGTEPREVVVLMVVPKVPAPDV